MDKVVKLGPLPVKLALGVQYMVHHPTTSVSGDSGSGAVLGDFRGRTVGLGPVLSYATKLWKKDLVAEVKWLPELDVKKQLDSDYIWFKLGMVF